MGSAVGNIFSVKHSGSKNRTRNKGGRGRGKKGGKETAEEE